MRKYLAECFGTMFLVLLACGSAVLAGPSIDGLGVGICFGLVLVCLCYALGNISGCHVNPAVSLGVWLSGRMSCKEFCGYVVAQLIGAVIGAAFLYIMTEVSPDFNFGGVTPVEGGQVATLAANVVQPSTVDGVTVFASQNIALIAECLLTFFFVFVVLAATDSKVGAGKFAGLAIGLALGLVNIVGIPVDNCSVNPARSFGPAVFSPAAWGDFWIMVVGPAVGAILAALCWRLVANTRKGIE